jgi:hypothetical protein
MLTSCETPGHRPEHHDLREPAGGGGEAHDPKNRITIMFTSDKDSNQMKLEAS